MVIGAVKYRLSTTCHFYTSRFRPHRHHRHHLSVRQSRQLAFSSSSRYRGNHGLIVDEAGAGGVPARWLRSYIGALDYDRLRRLTTSQSQNPVVHLAFLIWESTRLVLRWRRSYSVKVIKVQGQERLQVSARFPAYNKLEQPRVRWIFLGLSVEKDGEDVQ